MTEHRIIQGDCLDVLWTLPAESVHCVVTSPPYFGLRDYQVTGQIGLEATPVEFVAKMVAVFEEVRRVLRKDGTCWVNLGDSYSSNAGGYDSNGSKGATSSAISAKTQAAVVQNRSRVPFTGLKPKDLLGMPWRVAFALQTAGWWLRQDIIWAKPNPMPESVTDRCTKAHEYIFLLTKSAKYFYDADAITEPVSPNTHMRLSQNLADQVGSHRAHGGGKTNGPMKAVSRKAALGTQGMEKMNPSFDASVCMPVSARNKRSVWTVTTQPMPEAHFATFPPKLIEPCILAGTSEKGCCVDCGAPWERVVERVANYTQRQDRGQPSHKGPQVDSSGWDFPTITDLGWRKTCKCETDEVKPCTVLDPFAGAGTTSLVSKRLGRDSIGIELNPEYIEIIERRLEHYHKPQPPRADKAETVLPLFSE